MVERILDRQGNPIGITTLYHDQRCRVYFDTCFIRSFSEERTIFQYEDGRTKEFTNYFELAQFTQHLTPLPNPDQQRFPETQLRAKILEEENRNKPTQDSQEEPYDFITHENEAYREGLLEKQDYEDLHPSSNPY